MSQVIQGIGDPVVATWFWETGPDQSRPPDPHTPGAAGRRLEFSSRIAARAFLRSLDVLQLRHLVAEQLVAPAYGIDDGEVLDRIAGWIEVGRLRLVARPGPTLGTWGDQPDEEPAPPPVWREPAPVEEAVVEEQTFVDVDAEAIAVLMKEAARRGVPFCEECLKQKMAEARAADPDTMSENADAAAIAVVMREAAKSGVPFCEECMKAKAKQMRAGQGSAS